jgi:acetyl-CoA carboxylase biotin carboxyl carrier protein
MDLKKLKQFIQLAKDEGCGELKYESKELKISVNFNSGQYVQAAPIAQPQVALQASSQDSAKSVASSGSNYHEVKSPFVGTFYASPAPDKPAYVKVGDKVHKGQTLCILEAMKIMNEIESDKDGEIVEICVENESLVEFGHTLFKIK